MVGPIFGTVLYVLVVWTALSFGIGITWTILCFTRGGLSSTPQTKAHTRPVRAPIPYPMGRSRRA
jgi:hypothetical protein